MICKRRLYFSLRFVIGDIPNLDGKSFAPLLRDPELAWRPTLTIRGPESVSIHDERWNLIHRKNGVRELYDLKNDPMEWANLFASPEYEAEKNRLEKLLPSNYAPEVKNSKSEKKAKKLDQTIRPMRKRLKLK